ncbi:MAG: type VI secretion system baseplate subunit TssF [Desulfovibrio sp.]|jgi:type VI secretion system protein ImpG|nr:type VI secretion system baseplate subunit TssF [Desulfovibrio sp.]
MSFNRYFEREMVALRTLGREFAERNPALAAFLATPGRDPDVERILEGFSFLSGRLWQKLDDELPEITHGLFNLLWPHYLRPIPSGTVLQFKPTANISKAVSVNKGTRVESDPVEGTRCTFTTTSDTEILPIELTDLSFITKHGEAIMALNFRTIGTAVNNVPLRVLRFFLTGESAIVHTLYYALVRKVKCVRMVMYDQDRKEHVLGELGQEYMQPAGFSPDEALYPYPPNAFPGYRILQEYFCFPEKFHFVELSGLAHGFNAEKTALAGKKNEFSLHVALRDLPENFESFTAANIRLFCTPAVNLFQKSATPINMDHKQTEYRIVPDPRLPYHFSTYSVLRVESWSHEWKGDREFKPFESFEHVGGEEGTGAYYRLRIRPSINDDCIETYISLVDRDKAAEAFLNQTVSLELLCTNRLLTLSLGVGDISSAADNMDAALNFKNITPVTPPYSPPLDGDILWRLLSNMALNYIPLNSLEAMKGIVATYDFRAVHDSRRARTLANTLQGMTGICTVETDRIYHGLPVRGSRTQLILNQRKFSCEGEMFLFASILNEFLALYATVNSFHQLIVREEKSGEEYLWPARLGGQRL